MFQVITNNRHTTFNVVTFGPKNERRASRRFIWNVTIGRTSLRVDAKPLYREKGAVNRTHVTVVRTSPECITFRGATALRRVVAKIWKPSHREKFPKFGISSAERNRKCAGNCCFLFLGLKPANIIITIWWCQRKSMVDCTSESSHDSMCLKRFKNSSNECKSFNIFYL